MPFEQSLPGSKILSFLYHLTAALGTALVTQVNVMSLPAVAFTRAGFSTKVGRSI